MQRVDLERICGWIVEADGLVVTAGAGMGVDSGLPDFRGNEGFWNAYPALGNENIGFTEIANAHAFLADPGRSWGFYGHRLDLYRKVEPHAGFSILKRIGERLKHGCFVVTSNVDGQFQKAGFDPQNILEIHGSIHYLQCLEPCRATIWSADSLDVSVDDKRCRWVGKNLPNCPYCGGLARPNILMFDDMRWVSSRTDRQRMHWDDWRARGENMVVIELGAGIAIPSIRYISASLNAPIVRINKSRPAIDPAKGVGLEMGAEECLKMIDQELRSRSFFQAL